MKPLLFVLRIPVATTVVMVSFAVDRHLVDQIWFPPCLVIALALALLVGAQAADRESEVPRVEVEADQTVGNNHDR